MRRSIAAISFGALGLAFSAVAAASDKGGLSMGEEPQLAPPSMPPVVTPSPEVPTCPDMPTLPALELRARTEPPKVLNPPNLPAPTTPPKEVAPAVKRNVLKIVGVMTITTMEEGKPVTRVLFLVEGLRKGDQSPEETLMAIPFREAFGFLPGSGSKTTSKGPNAYFSPLVRCYGADSLRKWPTYTEREKKRTAESKAAEKTPPKSDTGSVLNAAAKGAMFLGGLTP